MPFCDECVHYNDTDNVRTACGAYHRPRKKKVGEDIVTGWIIYRHFINRCLSFTEEDENLADAWGR